MKKEKFHIEFLMGNATLNSLWRMVAQAEGLSEWFADEVFSDDAEKVYSFSWSGNTNQAKVLSRKPQASIRYQWIDEDEDCYFEFILHKLALSGDIALEITDFATPEEQGDTISLWESQIDELKRRLGI